MRLCLVALLFLLLLSGAAQAEDEEALRTQVAGWIADLRSDAFPTREAARKELLRHGLKARDLLEAAKDDEDAEVRRTVRAVLAGAPQTPAAATPQTDTGVLDGLGRITAEGKDVLLGAALRRIGAPVGATFSVPSSMADKTVSFDIKGQPFYAALQSILEPLRLSFPRSFDVAGAGATELRGEGVREAPWGASGPLRVRVTEVAATRTLGSVAPLKYALTIEITWAPCVQLVQMQNPQLDAATDPDGKAYQATAAMNRRITYGVSTSRRTHTVTLHVSPAELDCKPHLDVLEFRLPLTLRFDPAYVAFANVENLPRTLAQDGKVVPAGTVGSVTLHAVEAVEGRTGQYVVDFSAKVEEEASPRSVQAVVVEKDGRHVSLPVYGGRSSSGSGDGAVRIRARAWRPKAGPPPAIRVSWLRREEQGVLRFRVRDIPLR